MFDPDGSFAKCIDEYSAIYLAIPLVVGWMPALSLTPKRDEITAP